MSIDRPAAARLLVALADATEFAPPKMRTRHLAPRARALAEQLRAEQPAPPRVYLSIDAGVKAAIYTEMLSTGLAGEDDTERVYAGCIVIDRVLERLGLAVVPAPPARPAHIGGEAEEEAEIARYSHLVEG